MKNLTLVTTETFGSVPCDFYRSENEILLTREQIGTALEYDNPVLAMKQIHRRHKDRLDDLSIKIKLSGSSQSDTHLTKSEEQERIYYTERGIMEICRWSNKSKANEFMDWVWDIVESYRNNTLTLSQDNTLLLQEIQSLRQEINELKESKKPTLPTQKYSNWKTNTFNKLRAIMDKVNEYSDEELSLPNVMAITYKEFQDTYDIDLTDYIYQYKYEYGLPQDTKVYELDVISHYKELKHSYSLTIDSIMEKLHIQTEKYNTRNIFDIIAEKLNTAS